MSLYALTAAAVQGLKAQFWGAKIPTQFKANPDGTVDPVEGGDTRDTGVQAAITALVNRLSSTAPIDLAGPLELSQPGNAPAIRIFVNNSGNVDGPGGGDGGGGSNNIIQVVNNYDGTVTNVNQFWNTTVGGNSGNTNNSTGSSGTTGFTGSVVVVTSFSVSVVGCNVTINPVNLTLTFQDGLLVNVQ